MRKRTAGTLFVIAAAILLLSYKPHGVGGQGPNLAVIVSAASFTPLLAPEAIAAAFGANLATQMAAAGGPVLPTNLAGTTVQVNGTPAQLFFVSPNQINFLIPAGTPAGVATVTITSGNGTVSTGTIQISQAAPAVFTLNQSGIGLPAAYVLRVKPDNSQTEEPVTQAINFGPAEDRLFLVLFLSGLRSGGAVQVHIGGIAHTPVFVGQAPGFFGLDQVNVELQRQLSGRGRVPLFVTVDGALFSNVVDVDFVSEGGAPQITNFAPGATLAGDELMINGAGFSTDASANQVAILDAQGNPIYALVTSATANQLRVRVPYGASSGMLIVRTPKGEVQSATPVAMRTSVSGFLEEAVMQPDGQLVRRPLPNIMVRVRPAGGGIITRMTNADGSFIAPDVAPGLASLDVDPIATNLPYPNIRLKMPVVANRDNQYPSAIEMTQVQTGQGNSLSVNAGQMGGAMTTITPAPGLPTSFGLPDGCIVAQPPFADTSSLTISLFGLERAPINLPPGVFSKAIAQLTPFGALMTPGGTLRVPNTENLNAGMTVRLYRLDQPTRQTEDSPTIGQFIHVGDGVVQANGQITAIETGGTAQNGVKQTTYYLASPVYQMARISGRVLASDGTPVSLATIRTRGQSAFTAGDGTFTLENIPVIRSNDSVTLDVNYVRPDGANDRASFGPVSITPNGLTALGSDITLRGRTSPDQPLLLAPSRLTVNEGQMLDFSFLALSQPQPGQVVAVAATGMPFAVVRGEGNGVFTLRLAPGAGTAGEYLMRLTAKSGNGATYLLTIPVRVRVPGTGQQQPPPPPTTNDQSLVTTAGAARNITLMGQDPAMRQFNLQLVAQPANGMVTGNLPSNPTVVYTPRAGFTGIDSFTYRAVIPGTNVSSEVSTVYVIVR